MFLRKFFKILRGNATSFQLTSACLLASWIAFLPGFGQAPGLYLVFLGLLVILNANLLIAAVVGIVAQLVSLFVLPLSFQLGQILIDGPTAGLWEAMINAPVLAWFGFENYVASGGLILGAIFGLAASIPINLTILNLRKKLGQMERDSEAFKKLSSNFLVKTTAFFLIGGIKGKKSFEELAAAKTRNPFRLTGLVIVAGSVVLLIMAALFMDTAIMTNVVRDKLEEANGATVDLEALELVAEEGRLVITGLAVTDPENLNTNLFEASSITADVSSNRLLRKKMALDEVTIADGKMGSARRVPGQLTQPKPKIEKDPKEAKDPSEKSLEDYLEDAEIWKERLAQVQKWLEKINPPEDRSEGENEGQMEEKALTLKERLQQQAELLGYANVKAGHRITESPNFLIGLLEAEGVEIATMPDERFLISGKQLSTQPWLNPEPAALSIKTQSDKLGVSWELPVGDMGSLAFFFRDIPMELLQEKIAAMQQVPLEGGLVTVSADGPFAPSNLDLPLNVTIKNTTVSGMRVDTLTVPIQVTGEMTNPGIRVSDDALQNLVTDAAKSAIESKAQEEGKKFLEDQLGEGAGGLLDSVFGGGKKKDDPGN